MKKMIFTVLASVIFMTPALAAGKGTVTSIVNNTVGTVGSIIGGGATSIGGSSTSLGGAINISTGIGHGAPLSSTDDNAPTDGLYLGAQSDGNGFVSVRITKTLFRF